MCPLSGGRLESWRLPCAQQSLELLGPLQFLARCCDAGPQAPEVKRSLSSQLCSKCQFLEVTPLCAVAPGACESGAGVWLPGAGCVSLTVELLELRG